MASVGWGGVLNLEEFNLGKSPCLQEQTLIIDKDGSLKAIDDLEHIPPRRNSLKVGKAPYLLGISKFGEFSIYFWRSARDKVFPPLAKFSMQRRIIGCSRRERGARLLTLEELEPVGQFHRNSFFGTSRRQKISVEKQWGFVSIRLEFN